MSDNKAFIWACAIVLVVLIQAVCTWSIFGGAATCARACGDHRLSKWTGSQGVNGPEQCLCEGQK